MVRVEYKATRGGFTLVEILITIAILGILLMIGVSNLRGFNEKYKVEAETKQLFADLMDARGRAMQRNRASIVRINANDYQTYEDTFPAPDGDGSLQNTDTLITNTTRVPCHCHRRHRCTIELQLQPERDRLGCGIHPVFLDGAAGLRLHLDRGDPDQNGTIQCDGKYLCGKVVHRG